MISPWRARHTIGTASTCCKPRLIVPASIGRSNRSARASFPWGRQLTHSRRASCPARCGIRATRAYVERRERRRHARPGRKSQARQEQSNRAHRRNGRRRYGPRPRRKARGINRYRARVRFAVNFFNRKNPRRLATASNRRVGNMTDVPIGGDSVVTGADSWQVLRGVLNDMHPTDSGAIVNSATAMRVSAVYRSTALICGSVASSARRHLHAQRKRKVGKGSECIRFGGR
jgi:hypothetical protein